MKRTEITIERHSVTIIRTTGEPFRTHCRTCGCFVSAFDGGELARAIRLSAPAIADLETDGELHVVRLGSNMLCGNSVATYFDRQRSRAAADIELAQLTNKTGEGR